MKNNSSSRQKMTEEMRKKINRLACVVLQELSRKGKDDNVIFSPISVYELFSILADATSGKTQNEITGFLHAENDFDQAVKYLAELHRQIEGSSGYSSSTAVIVREDIRQSIAIEYEKRLGELFGGSIFTCDNLAVHLDSWVRKNTKDMIPSVWDASMNEMMLCMINACAFVADWQTQYEKESIWDADFHNLDHTISHVKMLHSYELTYVENEAFTGFAKPYKGGDFSYLVLLPKDKKYSYEEYIMDLDFAELIYGVDNTFANVTMPEFTCTTDVELTDIMERQGIYTIFTPKADFSLLSSEWLRVDSMKHKAHIEVERKGTKAAAVTDADFIYGAMPVIFPEEKNVFVNRPFIYAVVHNESGVPVFLGAVNHLDAWEGEKDAMTN